MGDAIISRTTDISKKADLNHKHSANDINSGNVSIENGGTGATTANDARINLEVPINKTIENQMTNFNDYTEVGFYSLYNPLYNVPDTSMSGNYSYSLIVAHGIFKNGTYDIDQLAVSQNGDMYLRHHSRSFNTWYGWQRINNTNAKPLEINKGGTGASSSEKARTNLGVYSKSEVDSKVSVLSEDINIYISPSGSDSTGDGSSSNPYATFNKVLSFIGSKKIDAQISVYVKAGTYNEELKLLYLSGAGRVRILGDSSSSVSFSSCRVDGNTLKGIEIHKIKISKESGTSTLYMRENTSYVNFYSMLFSGVYIDTSASNVTIDSCSFSNVTTAMSISAGSGAGGFGCSGAGKVVLSDTNTFTNVTTAANVSYGAMLIQAKAPTLNGAILKKSNGGMIVYPNGTFSEN